MSYQNRAVSSGPARVRTSWSAIFTFIVMSWAVWAFLTREVAPSRPDTIETMPVAISHDDMRMQTEALVRQRVGSELYVRGRTQAEIKGDKALLKCTATGSEIWHHRFFTGVFEREGFGFRLIQVTEN